MESRVSKKQKAFDGKGNFACAHHHYYFLFLSELYAPHRTPPSVETPLLSGSCDDTASLKDARVISRGGGAVSAVTHVSG